MTASLASSVPGTWASTSPLSVPTTTSVTLGTPGAAEGELADLRAAVSPAPDDGRVQFMEGNRLLGNFLAMTTRPS